MLQILSQTQVLTPLQVMIIENREIELSDEEKVIEELIRQIPTAKIIRKIENLQNILLYKVPQMSLFQMSKFYQQMTKTQRREILETLYEEHDNLMIEIDLNLMKEENHLAKASFIKSRRAQIYQEIETLKSQQILVNYLLTMTQKDLSFLELELELYFKESLQKKLLMKVCKEVLESLEPNFYPQILRNLMKKLEQAEVLLENQIIILKNKLNEEEEIQNLEEELDLMRTKQEQIHFITTKLEQAWQNQILALWEENLELAKQRVEYELTQMKTQMKLSSKALALASKMKEIKKIAPMSFLIHYPLILQLAKQKMSLMQKIKGENLMSLILKEMMKLHQEAMQKKEMMKEEKLTGKIILFLMEYQNSLMKEQIKKIPLFHKVKLNYPNFKNPLSEVTTKEELKQNLMIMKKKVS